MAERRLTMNTLLPWVARALWASLPFTVGSACASALDGRSDAVQGAASVALWLGWGVVVCATLVAHPLSLTLFRLAAPAAVVASAAAWRTGAGSSDAALALLGALTVCAVAFLPETAMFYVNGPAYANEVRFPLRAPGPLLLGPIAIAWALTVLVPAAGVLLLAAKQFVAGSVTAATGVAAAVVLGRSLYVLAKRWIVFVPAGVVVHDPMQLADPILVRRKDIRSFAAAAADTDATDLTARALGLALELQLSEPATLARQKPGSRTAQHMTATKVLLTPTRPGAVLRAARDRRID